MKVSKPVTRETDTARDGRPLIIEIHPKHVVLREKGRRHRHTVTYDQIFSVASQGAAETAPDETTRGIIGPEERQAFDRHYIAVADLMRRKGLWRNTWRVSLPDGAVFNFQVTGYARTGTPAWSELKQREKETAAV